MSKATVDVIDHDQMKLLTIFRRNWSNNMNVACSSCDREVQSSMTSLGFTVSQTWTQHKKVGLASEHRCRVRFYEEETRRVYIGWIAQGNNADAVMRRIWSMYWSMYWSIRPSWLIRSICCLAKAW